MTVELNGERLGQDRWSSMAFSYADMIAYASRGAEIRPGDVLGSGTVGTGCILEHGDGRWLQPGDVVELEVEGIGVLRNTVGRPRA